MAEAKTSSVKSMVLPPLVLALICAVCCAFLALANMVTRDKIAAAEADAIQTSLKQLPDAGTFEEVTDFQPENNEKASATGLYLDENGQYVSQWMPIVAASQLVKHKPEEKDFLMRWIDVFDYE